MNYDKTKESIIPIKIDTESGEIICKVIKKSNNFRKSTKRLKSKKIISFKVDEKLEIDTIESKMFQYKVARCGSTLLSNMLECDESWKVISEPNVFNSIIKNKKINKQKYLKKLVEILSIRETKNQTHCYFDFTSQFLFSKPEMDKVFPGINNFYLYRRPVEVSISLEAKRPGWMRKYSSPKQYLEKVCDTVKNTRVHYYRNVLSMQVVDWIYSCNNKELSNDLYNRMKNCLGNYSKKTVTEYEDPDEPMPRNSNGKYDDYFYNEKFTNFFLKNPPYKFLEEGSNKILKLDWSSERERVLEMFDKGTKPFVLKNVNTTFSLEKTRNKWDNKMSGLRAFRENYFIWHSSGKPKPKNYEFLCKWDRVTFEEWQKLKDMYLVIGSNVKATEHESFEYFLKKCKDNEKTGHLRISHNGAVTCEHFDSGDTILFVGGGKKKMYLLEPPITNQLGVYSSEHCLSRRLIPNLMYLDTNQYNIDRSKIWWGDIEENELIYFPGKWAHLTITESENTWSINFRRSSSEKRKIIRNNLSIEQIDNVETDMHPYFRKGTYY